MCLCVCVIIAIVGRRWMSAKDTIKAATDSCSRFNFGFSLKVDQAEVDWRFAQRSIHLHTHTLIHTHPMYAYIYIVFKCIEAIVKCKASEGHSTGRSLLFMFTQAQPFKYPIIFELSQSPFKGLLDY